MVTRMHILLEPNMDSGSVALFESKRYLCGGDAYTDLQPGKYKLTTDFIKKQWTILGVGPKKIRFTLDIDGPDPFKLSYSSPVDLEITTAQTADSYVPDPFIDVLPNVGPGAYRADSDYVDNGLVGGEFDVIGGSFTLRYEDGSTLDLTAYVPWSELVTQSQSTGGASIYVYYKLKPPANAKILPRFFDKNSAPNITFMVKDITETLPGAQAGIKLSRLLLDLITARAQTRPSPSSFKAGGVSRAARIRALPAAEERIAPVNGVVNVGGGLESGSAGMTNLNPIVLGTGGPTRGIPNHVAAGFEDMGGVFRFDSVQKVVSNRLPFGTVNWPQSANAAYSVMTKGGKLQLNVWTSSQQEVDQVIRAFTDAGFKDVKNMTGVGPGTFVVGVK